MAVNGGNCHISELQYNDSSTILYTNESNILYTAVMVGLILTCTFASKKIISINNIKAHRNHNPMCSFYNQPQYLVKYNNMCCKKRYTLVNTA